MPSESCIAPPTRSLSLSLPAWQVSKEKDELEDLLSLTSWVHLLRVSWVFLRHLVWPLLTGPSVSLSSWQVSKEKDELEDLLVQEQLRNKMPEVYPGNL